MSGIRSPGRREMMRQLAGKRANPTWFSMHGKVPTVIEEDKEFFLLFQESKRLEAKCRDAAVTKDAAALQLANDKFNACINKIRARWLELVPEDRPS